LIADLSNRYRIDGDRDTVIAKHERLLVGQRDLLRALDEPRGYDLVLLNMPLRAPSWKVGSLCADGAAGK
jgi:hypothetical protein